MIRITTNNSRFIKTPIEYIKSFDELSLGQEFRGYKVISIFVVKSDIIRIIFNKKKYFIYNKNELYKEEFSDDYFVFKELKINV